MRVGAVLIVLALAWAGVRLVGADAGAGTITLSRGWNVVTWNGAEPYAIDNFADTPVTGRFTAGTQRGRSGCRASSGGTAARCRSCICCRGCSICWLLRQRMSLTCSIQYPGSILTPR